MSDTLRDALQRIAAWELPATGQFWPSGNPVGYEAEYGSNGARDYIRGIARAALAAAEQPAAPKFHFMPCEAVTIDGVDSCKTCGQMRSSTCPAGGMDVERLREPPGPAQPGAVPFGRPDPNNPADWIEPMTGAAPIPAVPQPVEPVATFINMSEGTEYPPSWYPLTNAEAAPSFKRYFLFATPQPDASAGAQRETDSERVLRLMASGWLVAHNESWSALTDEANTATAWFCERTAAPFCTSRYESVRRWTGPTPIAALDASIADLGAEFPTIGKVAAPTPATPGETK